MRPGVTAAAATAEIDSIVHATSGYGLTSEPLLKNVTAQAAPALKAAFAAVLCCSSSPAPLPAGGLAFTFAAAALALAALGVYGAMAFSVVQRRRELAVRAALGAQRRQLAGLVLARGARIALLGICFGLASAFALSRFLGALLYGVGERDPLTLVAATATLGSVAVLATLLPALAAARLDPMTVLRTE